MIDKCPLCNGDLIAVCNVVVEYIIHNEPDGESQDWERDNVDDDNSEILSIKCDDCGHEWFGSKVELDDEGFLVGLKD